MKSGQVSEKIIQAKQKIVSYCAYQERCQKEVRKKLYSFGLFGEQVEELITWLITEDFVNEERYAVMYAGGKFRLKQWGKLKITQALKQNDISNYCIRKAILEIDEQEYLDTITKLASKKLEELNPVMSNPYQLKDKVSKYIINKGFEPDLVWDILRQLAPS